MNTIKQAFDRLWSGSRSLTAFGISMLLLTAICGSLALIDPTEVDDQVRWIKPAKFGISFALYSFCVAWILGYVSPGRMRSAISGLLMGTGFVEIFVITLQAARARTSHFNNETPLDAVLFGIMGAGIVVFFVANMIAVVLAMRARIADRVLATGLRLGFAVASIGMFEGVLMLIPTAEQSAQLAAGGQPARLGTHSVGEGDLRPAHFAGLHALQLLPLAALAIRRRRRWSDEQKVRLLWTAATAHASLVGLLTWQALRGQAIMSPDALALGLLATIAFATCVAAFLIDQQPIGNRLAEVAR